MDTAASLVFANLIGNPLEAGRAWVPFREGIMASWLYRTDNGGPAAALLRYEPGVKIPPHRHLGWETMIVLSGSQVDGTGLHTVGDVVASPPGGDHSGDSPNGCIVLLIWERTPQVY